MPNDAISTILSHIHGEAHTKTITINGRPRQITVYSERDQDVHRLAKDVIMRDYRKEISIRCFAYISGRSAIDAIIDAKYRAKSYNSFVKSDIKSFFPSINRQLLKKILQKKYDDRFVEKILSFVCQKDGGISQGSALSPLLSNIYLVDFDNAMSSACCYYRYSDDILIFCQDNETERLMSLLSSEAAKALLTLNNSKTVIGRLSDGVEFLGFHISDKGVTAGMDKKENIYKKIEEIFTARECGVKEQIDKMRLSVVGWQNYYKEAYVMYMLI